MALDLNCVLRSTKKLQKLVQQIDRKATPDQVHRLRTQLRRFEAQFEALSLDRRGVAKSVWKGLAELRKRAGKVRDMDVLTDHASTIHIEGEEECSVQLLEHLGAERGKLAGKLYATADRVGPALRKALKRTATEVGMLIREKAEAPRKKAVAVCAIANAVQGAAQLADPPRLNHENLHPYRLRVKELRIVLQMGDGNSRSRFVEDLGRVKDSIGEWHDWQELFSIAGKVLDHKGRCGLLAELRRIADRKYAEAVKSGEMLRERYLHQRRVPGELVWEAIGMLFVGPGGGGAPPRVRRSRDSAR